MAKHTNQQWLAALGSPRPEREAALADLHWVILRGLPYALSGWLSPTDPRFEPLAEEVTQETLLQVLDYLHTFESRSQFTTWVHKIAVRVALMELRRKRWQNVSLDELVDREDAPPPAYLAADSAPTPESAVEGADLLQKVQRVIAEELTDKQRQAITAIAIQGMPIAEVARRMGTNRNALYKLLHDSCLRLKRRLADEGLTPQDILAVFESGS